MSPWSAFGFAILLLWLPWLMMPRRRSSELHGFVGLLWCLNATYCAFLHRLQVVGTDPLPTAGPAILITNHTCCIDHMLLQVATRRLLGFIIAKEIYEIWWFKPFCDLSGCIPVKRNGNDLAAMRAALRALEQGRVMPVFIEGKITPSAGRELGQGKQGAAFLALRTNVPVIPAYVSGTPESNQIFPSLRTPSNAKVRFGPVIDLADLRVRGEGDRERLSDATERMMDALKALRDQVLVDLGEKDQSKKAWEPSDGSGPEDHSFQLSSASSTLG